MIHKPRGLDIRKFLTKNILKDFATYSFTAWPKASFLINKFFCHFLFKMKKMADVFQMSEEQMKSMKMFEIRNMVIETGIRILEF